MSESLKCTLMSRILWLENPEPWKIVTSKKSTDVSFILQQTLLSRHDLNRLMKSDNSSFDLSGYALVLGG